MNKDHAEHNENACKYLYQSGIYYDWVVTTAFYSAMHYVHHDLFPMEFYDESYENFNVYYGSRYNHLIDRPSKHQATIDLINNRLPNCKRFYRWLYDECYTARYNKYNVSLEMAKKAMDFLTYIKAHLNKI